MTTMRSFTLCLLTMAWQVSADMDMNVAAREPDHESSNDRTDELGASFLHALLANNGAVSSYDVSTASEQYYFRPDGTIFSAKQNARRLWSKSGNKHLFVQGATADKTGDEPIASVRGAAFSDSADFVIYDARGKRRGMSTSLEITRYGLGWPRFDTIGFVGFPHVRLDNDLLWLESLTIPGGGATGKFAGSDRVEVSWTGGDRENEAVRHVWLFDAHTLVPRTRTAFIVPRDGNPYIKERERYLWKQISENYLPVAISKEVVQVHVDRDSGLRTPYEHLSDTRFQWHRVNEELEDTEFSVDQFSSLHDLEVFLKFGEPFKTAP
jgi:hypothetical protein